MRSAAQPVTIDHEIVAAAANGSYVTAKTASAITAKLGGHGV